MKTMAQLILVTISFLSGSCSDEVKSLKKIDGDWKVSSLTFYGKNTPDSTYTDDNFTIIFEKCKKKDNHSPGCAASVLLNGESYKYRYSLSDDRILFSIDNADEKTAEFEGEHTLFLQSNVWDIITLNDRELSIRKNVGGVDEDFIEIVAFK